MDENIIIIKKTELGIGYRPFFLSFFGTPPSIHPAHNSSLNEPAARLANSTQYHMCKSDVAWSAVGFPKLWLAKFYKSACHWRVGIRYVIFDRNGRINYIHKMKRNIGKVPSFCLGFQVDDANDVVILPSFFLFFFVCLLCFFRIGLACKPRWKGYNTRFNKKKDRLYRRVEVSEQGHLGQYRSVDIDYTGFFFFFFLFRRKFLSLISGIHYKWKNRREGEINECKVKVHRTNKSV